MESATLDPPKVEKEQDDTPVQDPDETQRDVTEPPADDPQTPEPDGPNKPQDTGELEVEGSESRLNNDAGGKAPTDSKLMVIGKAIAVDGQFRKGQRIRATVELEVGGVNFQDKHDGPTGQVVACTRTARARIVGFARLD